MAGVTPSSTTAYDCPIRNSMLAILTTRQFDGSSVLTGDQHSSSTAYGYKLGFEWVCNFVLR